MAKRYISFEAKVIYLASSNQIFTSSFVKTKIKEIKQPNPSPQLQKRFEDSVLGPVAVQGRYTTNWSLLFLLWHQPPIGPFHFSFVTSQSVYGGYLSSLLILLSQCLHPKDWFSLEGPVEFCWRLSKAFSFGSLVCVSQGIMGAGGFVCAHPGGFSPDSYRAVT